MKLLLSRKDAAQAISLGQRSFDELSRPGRIKARRIGCRVFITPAELERFVAQDSPESIWSELLDKKEEVA